MTEEEKILSHIGEILTENEISEKECIKEIYGAIEGYSALKLPTDEEWISVKDRLPEKSGWYQVYRHGYEVHNSYFDKRIGNNWTDQTTTLTFISEPTHWQPLPKPPLNK